MGNSSSRGITLHHRGLKPISGSSTSNLATHYAASYYVLYHSASNKGKRPSAFGLNPVYSGRRLQDVGRKYHTPTAVIEMYRRNLCKLYVVPVTTEYVDDVVLASKQGFAECSVLVCLDAGID